jgi:hypothetical protein
MGTLSDAYLFQAGMLLYGKTHDGTYMKESEALANGFRQAGAK